MSGAFAHPLNIAVAKGVYKKYPLVQKLGDCLCVPPILVKDSITQLGQFGHRQQDVFHDEVVQTDIDIEGGRNESEEEFDEGHLFVYLRLKQGIDDF